MKPGFNEKNSLHFEGKGNEHPEHQPTDLIVRFKEKPSHQLVRRGHDIVQTVDVPFMDAINAEPVSIVRGAC